MSYPRLSSRLSSLDGGDGDDGEDRERRESPFQKQKSAQFIARALLFLERFPTSVDNPLAKGGFKFLSYYVGPNAGISCFGEAKKADFEKMAIFT